MGMKKSIFSQETYDFQIFGNETVIITRYEDIKLYNFHLLAVKSRLHKDVDLHTNNHPNLFIQKCKLSTNSAFFES